MILFDTDSIVLKDKIEKDGIVYFTMWSCAQINRQKLSSIISNIYELDYNHETSAGYWIYISIPKETFEEIINKIKEIFFGNVTLEKF